MGSCREPFFLCMHGPLDGESLSGLLSPHAPDQSPVQLSPAQKRHDGPQAAEPVMAAPAAVRSNQQESQQHIGRRRGSRPAHGERCTAGTKVRSGVSGMLRRAFRTPQTGRHGNSTGHCFIGQAHGTHYRSAPRAEIISRPVTAAVKPKPNRLRPPSQHHREQVIGSHRGMKLAASTSAVRAVRQ